MAIKMRKLHSLARASFLVLVFAVTSYANNRWIVQFKPNAIGTNAATMAQQYGGSLATVVNASQGIYSISLPGGQLGTFLVQLIQAAPMVQSIEPDNTLLLPEAASKSTGHRLPGLKTYAGSLKIPTFNSTVPWDPYLNQPANTLIRLQAAQQKYGYGSGLVAVIDTGVDYHHPLLLPPVTDVLQAADFTGSGDPTGNADLSQETTPILDQETTPILDGNGSIILNQETTPLLDQETTPLLDSSLPPDFGHGTMVAGIIHLVAPHARILPIKAFNSSGVANLSGVIAGIYYAVNAGATVINASWSTAQPSIQLTNAINYAHSRGVPVVAAVGNNGAQQNDYPAAIPNVIGIASITDQDVRSVFSDYGSDVDLAAPGEAIVSTYPCMNTVPCNVYAMGWGTSFATPFVTGTVALIQSLKSNANPNQAQNDLGQGADPLKGLGLGAGQLDVYGAAAAAK